MVRYGDAGRGRLANAVIVVGWANWAITFVKAFLNVRGLDLSGGGANVAVALLLQVFVVIPALVASFAWAWGLRGGARQEG